jgi:hypothetical protein
VGGALIGAAALSASGSEAFAPYFGPLHPLVAVPIVVIPGGVALLFLRSGGWFEIRRVGASAAEGLRVAAAVAGVLTIPVIVVDVLGGFPPGINVQLPGALVFYPVIGLVAEMVFHVLPLALLLGTLGTLLRSRLGEAKTVWVAMLLASAIEPVFQVVAARGESPTWAVTYVGLHLTAFNLLALAIFRRYDFLTLYAFRVVYYLGWHILWGWARLRLLF